MTPRRLQLFVVPVHEPRRCEHCWCCRHKRDEHRKTCSATGTGAAHIASGGTTDSVMHITTGASVAIPAGAGAMSSTAGANALGSTPGAKAAVTAGAGALYSSDSAGASNAAGAVALHHRCRCCHYFRSWYDVPPPRAQVLRPPQELVRCTSPSGAGAAVPARAGAMYSTTGAEGRSSHGPILRSEGRLASEPFNVLLRTKMKIKIRCFELDSNKQRCTQSVEDPVTSSPPHENTPNSLPTPLPL